MTDPQPPPVPAISAHHHTAVAAGASESEPPAKRQRLLSTSSPSQQVQPSSSSMSDTSIAMAISDPNSTSTPQLKGEDTTGTMVTALDVNRAEPNNREAAMGIIHFITTSNSGFCGTLKQRYTDFIVNEITPDGCVVHLTDTRALGYVKSEEAKSQEQSRPKEKTPEQAAATADSGAVVTDTTAPDVTTAKAEIAEGESLPAANVIAEAPKVESAAPPATIEAQDSPDTPENREKLSALIGPEKTQKVFDMFAAILENPNAKTSFYGKVLLEPMTDRTKRGNIHTLVRHLFLGKLQSTTDNFDVISIIAGPPASRRPKSEPKPNARNTRVKGHGRNQVPQGKAGWNELGGEYLHFTLYKENKDTMECIYFLSRLMKVNTKDFAFSGTKDRRAVTSQRVSVFRQISPTMANLNRPHVLRQVRVGNFKHEKFGLELGELYGNQFTITLRDCHFTGEDGLDHPARILLAKQIVGDSVAHLQADGFINYYGLQRFGTHAIGTDEIGKLILQGNFTKAVFAILQCSKESEDCVLRGVSTAGVNQDDIARTQAILQWQNDRKSPAALSQIPRRYHAETTVIRSLASKHNPSEHDCLNALLLIPRNLRTMYVHAYQSKVWNLAASERWSRYGMKVIEGDLVLVNTPAAIANANRDEIDENGEVVVHPANGDAAYTQNDLFQRARALSAEEAASGDYTVYDVVLPTPGFDIEYPLNDIGDFYKEWMGSEEGGKLDPGNMRRKNRDFSLSGSYRKFLAHIGKDMTFEVKSYHEATEQFVQTDGELLDKAKPARPQQPKTDGQQRNNGRNDARGVASNGSRGDVRGGVVQQLINQRNSANVDSSRSKNEYLGTPAHNAWLNAAAIIKEQDKAAIAASKAAHQAALAEGSYKLPVMKETFIEASTDGSLIRTKGAARVTTIPSTPARQPATEANGVASPALPPPPPPTPATNAPTPAISALNTPINIEEANNVLTTLVEKPEVEPVEINKPIQNGLKPKTSSTSLVSSIDPDDGGANLHDTAAGSSNSVKEDADKSGVKEKKDVEESGSLKRNHEEISKGDSGGQSNSGASPANIAVVVKFSLGSSQYATIALRELMKQGGVKTYKPEFTNAS